MSNIILFFIIINISIIANSDDDDTKDTPSTQTYKLMEDVSLPNDHLNMNKPLLNLEHPSNTPDSDNPKDPTKFTYKNYPNINNWCKYRTENNRDDELKYDKIKEKYSDEQYQKLTDKKIEELSTALKLTGTINLNIQILMEKILQQLEDHKNVLQKLNEDFKMIDKLILDINEIKKNFINILKKFCLSWQIFKIFYTQEVCEILGISFEQQSQQHKIFDIINAEAPLKGTMIEQHELLPFVAETHYIEQIFDFLYAVNNIITSFPAKEEESKNNISNIIKKELKFNIEKFKKLSAFLHNFDLEKNNIDVILNYLFNSLDNIIANNYPNKRSLKKFQNKDEQDLWHTKRNEFKNALWNQNQKEAFAFLQELYCLDVYELSRALAVRRINMKTFLPTKDELLLTKRKNTNHIAKLKNYLNHIKQQTDMINKSMI